MRVKRNEGIDIKNLNLDELEELVASLGEERYRARQIMEWVYHHHASSFEEMTNLPKELRSKIANTSYISNFNTQKVQTSNDGTHKFLFELKDGNCIETVLIPEKKHRTICVSTQLGCALGCKFCFSGKGGLIRNLDTSEIVNQIWAIKNEFIVNDETINIVFMGMGEPLANYENTLKALYILTSPFGFNFSHRRITVSTAGLIPQIKRLGQELPVNLAISLNAASNSLRNYLMPINKKYSLDKLLEVASKTPLPSRKRITFEYILIKNINDSLKDAKALASLLRGIRCKINLIPFNEHKGVEFKRPDDRIVEEFRKFLVSKHFTVMVRESKGNNISAACGQLALV
jgi:23S rRNA (adenine2503-C2)-methyltransferase